MTSAGSASEIVFRGQDGNECEAFIAAIEELAFTEGWSEDQKRMLLFARSRLRQGALRWFARLDPSKKKDWDLFVEALFEQYPPVQAPAEAEISTPVWSATTFSPGASTAILSTDQGIDSHPDLNNERHATGVNTRDSFLPHSKTYDPSIPGRQVGILRIVAESGTACPEYIWRGRPPTEGNASRVQLRTTINRQEALVVSFIPSSEPFPIGCLNAAHDLSDLFLRRHSTDPLQYELGVKNGVEAIPKEGVGYPGSVSKVWNVASDGSLEVHMSLTSVNDNHSGNGRGGYTKKLEDFKTSEVHFATPGTSIRFMKPGTPLWQNDPNRNSGVGRYDFKARIVFEPF